MMIGRVTLKWFLEQTMEFQAIFFDRDGTLSSQVQKWSLREMNRFQNLLDDLLK
jgi:hypothetical protein